MSREVTRLERRLGAQLLRRSTRSLSLTEIGESFRTGCQRMAEEAARAERSAAELQGEPRGELRLATAVSFGQVQIAPRLPAFLARHPKVRLRMDLSDRLVDLVRDKVDLAIRISGRLTDSTIVQRRLCRIRFVACATPGYLERSGTPRSVAALERHGCLGTGAPPWRLLLGRQRVSRLRGSLDVDNGEALRRVALTGHGIVCLPTYLVGDDLAAGRLVQILPEALTFEASAFAIYPRNRHPSPKVRALIDYLVESLGPEPEWDAYERLLRSPRTRSVARRKPSGAASRSTY